MLKDIVHFYNFGVLKILGFISLIVFPFQLLIYGWIYYLYQLELDSIEKVFVLYLYVFMFIATQRPFSKLYIHLRNNDECTLYGMLRDFFLPLG